MSLFTPLLWSLLPSQLTHILLPYLTTSIPFIFPPSPRNTPTYARNYRIVFTLLVLGYLGYSLLSEGGDGDWYGLLVVSKGADDETLRRAFRTLSRTHHPDRAGLTNDDTFIAIRRAYEILSDPVKRYAYDRFGPDVAEWKGPTVRELMHTGVMQSAGFYIVSGGFMLVLSLLGRAQEGAYWRNVLFILLLTLELHLIVSPTPSPSTSFFPPLNRPQFAQIRLLHRLFTSASIALTQLASVWSPVKSDTSVLEFRQVAGMVKALEMEAVGAFHAEVVPMLRADAMAERVIKGEMEQVLVDRAIASHPQIRPIWHEALSRSLTPLQPKEVSGDVEIARKIPLPPSPPLTPRSSYSQLHE